MVMEGTTGISLECEACGHEDALFFRQGVVSLRKIAFAVKNFEKCPKCGGKMRENKQKHIVF